MRERPERAIDRAAPFEPTDRPPFEPTDRPPFEPTDLPPLDKILFLSAARDLATDKAS